MKFAVCSIYNAIKQMKAKYVFAENENLLCYKLPVSYAEQVKKA